MEVDTFNSSLASLISSGALHSLLCCSHSLYWFTDGVTFKTMLLIAVTKKDVESSKRSFVTSASALQKWTALTGFDGQLKGLY